jgi:hypothetical protein
LRRLLADPYSRGSISAWTRARRWASFEERFPEVGEMRVIDLGGEARSWDTAPVRPRELVLVNTKPQPPAEDGRRVVHADACDLPAALRGERFDLVFSNSVIEHVGGHWRRSAFADAVHGLADHHWVQTPYRYFPVEPHWLFPGFQFLPLRARAELTRRWRLGRNVRELDNAVESSLTVELLSETEMRHYFPTSEIRRERVLGLTKSLIAVR